MALPVSLPQDQSLALLFKTHFAVYHSVNSDCTCQTCLWSQRKGALELAEGYAQPWGSKGCFTTPHPFFSNSWFMATMNVSLWDALTVRTTSTIFPPPTQCFGLFLWENLLKKMLCQCDWLCFFSFYGCKTFRAPEQWAKVTSSTFSFYFLKKKTAFFLIPHKMPLHPCWLVSLCYIGSVCNSGH